MVTAKRPQGGESSRWVASDRWVKIWRMRQRGIGDRSHRTAYEPSPLDGRTLRREGEARAARHAGDAVKQVMIQSAGDEHEGLLPLPRRASGCGTAPDPGCLPQARPAFPPGWRAW